MTNVTKLETMELKGKLYDIFEIKQIKDNFRKRDFVLEYTENTDFMQYVKFELIQDKCDILDNFQIGDNIIVYFNIRGRQWTNPQGEKIYFTTLNTWKIEKAETGTESHDLPQDDTDLPF